MTERQNSEATGSKQARAWAIAVAATLMAVAIAGPGSAVAQAISDSVVVDGKKVRIQKFTLSCDFPSPADLGIAGPPTVLPAERLWETVHHDYTVHLLDTNALPASASAEYWQPPWDGYFAWHSQK